MQGFPLMSFPAFSRRRCCAITSHYHRESSPFGIVEYDLLSFQPASSLTRHGFPDLLPTIEARLCHQPLSSPTFFLSRLRQLRPFFRPLVPAEASSFLRAVPRWRPFDNTPPLVPVIPPSLFFFFSLPPHLPLASPISMPIFPDPGTACPFLSPRRRPQTSPADPTPCPPIFFFFWQSPLFLPAPFVPDRGPPNSME